jgi:hypothetical protein
MQHRRLQRADVGGIGAAFGLGCDVVAHGIPFAKRQMGPRTKRPGNEVFIGTRRGFSRAGIWQ